MQKYCSYCLNPVQETDRLCPFCGKPVDAEAPYHHLLPGTMLQQRYYIGAALGQGGFGITYAGYDTQLCRKVAVKEYYPNGFVSRHNTVSETVVSGINAAESDFFEKGKKRFLEEARTLAGFSGIDGIVNVMDCFSLNNTVYIIMEFIEGITLKQYVGSGGKIPVADAINLLMPVMQSLRQIHAKGLIHRDISPDNIMLVQNGDRISAKLIDFGAAREAASVGGKSLTVVLKPGFAPFEQYTFGDRQGPWTDVYALCATLYFCITGAVPPAAPDRIINDPLRSPASFGVAIGAREETVLLKGLTVSAQDRYHSIDALLKDLFSADASEEKDDREPPDAEPGTPPKRGKRRGTAKAGGRQASRSGPVRIPRGASPEQQSREPSPARGPSPREQWPELQERPEPEQSEP